MDTGVTQRLVGTGLVVCVAIIWITSSFVVQDLETHKPVSPFVISLLANSLFVLFLPLAYLRRRFFTPNEKSKTTLSDWHIFTSAALVNPPPHSLSAINAHLLCRSGRTIPVGRTMHI